MIIVKLLFSESSILKILIVYTCTTNYDPHDVEKPPFSNSSGLKSVFEKPRFRDGLVWRLPQTPLRVK